MREWDNKPQRVMVPDEGFAWNGTTYRSLTDRLCHDRHPLVRPRFFGLRSREEKPA